MPSERVNEVGTFISRRILTALVILLAPTTGAQAIAEPSPTLLTPGKMAVVDGKPRFLLGLYENPKDDAVLKAAVEAGFNIIRSSPSREALDRLQKHGTKAWVNLGKNLDLSRDTEKRKASLTAVVNKLKDHPALLIWEGPDEALWNAWYARHLNYYWSSGFSAMDKAIKAFEGEHGNAKARPIRTLAAKAKDLLSRGLWKEFDAAHAEVWQRLGTKPPRPDATMADRAEDARRVGEGLTRGMQLVRQADPGHLIWLNHAPRNSIAAMRFHNRAADMAGCDIYPVPAEHAPGHSDLRTRRLFCVADYTDRMRAAAPGKACVMVLQGFGWRDINEGYAKQPKEVGIGRRPTWDETYYMAFEAIVHGANAIMYWGTRSVEKDSRLWNDLLRLSRVLKTLEPVLVAPTIEPAPKVVTEESYGSLDGDGIVGMLKRAGDDYALILVNETSSGVAFHVSGLPTELEGEVFHRMRSDETHTVKDGAFRDGIRSMGVHIYTTFRLPPNK